jgi:hypothetical protein
MGNRNLERGPQGDLGQQGYPGATGPVGPQGEPGRNWRFNRGPALRTLAFLFVVIVAIFAVYTVNEHNINARAKDERANIAARARAELRTCVRVQYLRDQANGTNFLIFDTFMSVRDQMQKVIDSGKLRGTALKQAEASVKRANDVVQTTVVTGPTDCHAATFDDNYKAPAPEFIIKNGPRVKAARKSAARIVRKAEIGQPLYDASKQPRP